MLQNALGAGWAEPARLGGARQPLFPFSFFFLSFWNKVVRGPPRWPGGRLSGLAPNQTDFGLARRWVRLGSRLGRF